MFLKGIVPARRRDQSESDGAPDPPPPGTERSPTVTLSSRCDMSCRLPENARREGDVRLRAGGIQVAGREGRSAHRAAVRCLSRNSEMQTMNGARGNDTGDCVQRVRGIVRVFCCTVCTGSATGLILGGWRR